jgi:hypothetical protein
MTKFIFALVITALAMTTANAQINCISSETSAENAERYKQVCEEMRRLFCISNRRLDELEQQQLRKNWREWDRLLLKPQKSLQIFCFDS